ncbi:MAG: permease-like cell division protein FtsX, partial [Bacteroidales bacterium]|nr:permease-like cell division protein FtsX [Bacteroidales bacterium]
MGKHRFFNMYLTSAISIAMVLFLVGLLGTMLLSAHSLMQHIKENMAITITLKPQAQVGATDVLHEYLNSAPFTKSVRYISQQQALKEHIQALG